MKFPSSLPPCRADVAHVGGVKLPSLALQVLDRDVLTNSFII